MPHLADDGDSDATAAPPSKPLTASTTPPPPTLPPQPPPPHTAPTLLASAAPSTPPPSCVIVLDVDGVLHPLGESGSPRFASMADIVARYEADQLLPDDGRQVGGTVDGEFIGSCMSELARVLRLTGAQVVLSSTWRETTAPRNAVTAALGRHGMPAPAGCTPRLSVLRGGRAAEILDWAAAQQPTPPCWVALDDLDLATPTRPGWPALAPEHFVRVDPAMGLTRADGDRAITRLLQQQAKGGAG